MRDGLNKAAGGPKLQPAPAASPFSSTGAGYFGPTSSQGGLSAGPAAAAAEKALMDPGQPDGGGGTQMIESQPPISSSSTDIRQQRQQKSSYQVKGERDIFSSQRQTNNEMPVEQQGVTQDKNELDQPIKLDDYPIRTTQGAINYWHYKQTGIKSRPIKLIKHPIEHIERKIIFTYLLGFLFKFIAIITGPLIVLIVFLMTVPSIALRRATWFILNLPFTFDARIRTLNTNDDEDDDDDDDDDISLKNVDCHNKVNSVGNKLDKQISWHYCPFNYLETYWFKGKLVNTVIMLVDHQDHAQFSIDKLQCLVRDQILSRPIYRKFLSQVVKRGFPFYKSYYWHYLGLANGSDQDSQRQAGREDNFNLDFIDAETDEMNPSNWPSSAERPEISGDFCSNSASSASTSSSGSSVGQLSSIATKTAHQSVQIAIEPEPVAPLNRPATEPTVGNQQSNQVHLSNHIFVDKSLGPHGASKSTIRRYARQLIGTKLDLCRPLWEIRLVPASKVGKSYLIFRCHQSLADGKSLLRILTNNLTLNNLNPSQKCRNDLHKNATNHGTEAQQKREEEEEEDENRLSLTKEKPSFVGSVSRTASLRSAIIVGPLTVLLWVIWTFTRRKNNHLNKRVSIGSGGAATTGKRNDHNDQRRFYMAQYSLTKLHQIKQMTRSTVCDVILCALSGALRDYLRKFNGVTNPPNLNISLAVDMRQDTGKRQKEVKRSSSCDQEPGELFSQSLFASGGSETHPSGHTQMSQTNRGQQQPEVAPAVNCTLVNVPLPTSVEGIVPRLWELRNTMDELRTSADPWVMLGLQQFLFNLMPISWYQWLINCIALRNSSTIVSNIRGPQNLVEAWCVDLLQRAILESQQAPRTIQRDPTKIGSDKLEEDELDDERFRANRSKRPQLAKLNEVKFLEDLGSISEIYYCMQPPASDIPISFNCITYHDRLFVSALSRTLLVEDSKLLIRLFFRQLDQLTNTIAKRRRLVTIVRTPIEISCQPASPQSSSGLPSPAATAAAAKVQLGSRQDDYDDEIGSSIEAPYFEGTSSGTVYRHKDDLEANMGPIKMVQRCKDCEQPVCTCRQRGKSSLISSDHHQRQHNLLSLLIPIQLMGLKGSGSRSIRGAGQDGRSTSLTPASECLCGQKLLEELDEEDRTELVEGMDRDRDSDGASSNGTRTPSDDGGRTAQLGTSSGANVAGGGGSDRPCCPKCRPVASKRSTLSLNDEQLQGEQAHGSHPQIGTVDNENGTPSGSSQKLDRNRSKRATHSSAQLDLPQSEGFPPKAHSKSETDLLPTSKSVKAYKENQRGSKDSWFTMGRLSMFSKSNQSGQNQQRSVSSRASAAHIGSSQETVSRTRHRNLIEMPMGIESGNKQNSSHQQYKRRRQSVATSTGASHIHRSVVVKDKINADVSLRLDTPFMGIRTRRFSAIGNAVVGSQRRGSLLPFGLIQNQSLPKLFWDDGEAHL